MRGAQPLPDEPPGTHMRYSTSVTQLLALAVENVSGYAYVDMFKEYVKVADRELTHEADDLRQNGSGCRVVREKSRCAVFIRTGRF